MKKIKLDCDNFLTTINSLSQIYAKDISQIIAILKTPNCITSHSKNGINITERVVKKLGSPQEHTHTSWFHFTSIIGAETFTNGIQPSKNISNYILEKFAREITDARVSEQALNLLRTGSAGKTISKQEHDSSHGPFAYLIKECGYHLKDSNEFNYLEIPEIIDDFCHDFRCHYSMSIRETAIKLHRPQILKFHTSSINTKREREAALNFIYLYVNNLHPNEWLFSCGYDGAGHHIPVEQIDYKKAFVDGKSELPCRQEVAKHTTNTPLAIEKDGGRFSIKLPTPPITRK